MLFAFLEPLLAYLELWFVFWPVVIILLGVTIFALPGQMIKKGDSWNGNTALALGANVLLFVVLLYKLGVHVTMWELYLPIFVGYLIVGIVWATVRWRVFLGNKRDYFMAQVTAWADSEHLTYLQVKSMTMSQELREAFYRYMYHSSDVQFYRYMRYPGEGISATWREIVEMATPEVAEHKRDILTNLICWPMSFVKWVVADMVRDLLNNIFEAMRNRLQGMARSAFKDVY